jgi:toxin CcdB
MAQFCVYRNPNPRSKATAPLLLDVQSELLDGLNTRVVIPLCLATTMKGKLMNTLTPVFEIDGKGYALLTPQLAGIPKRHIGAKVADLSAQRFSIIAALDLLITGI